MQGFGDKVSAQIVKALGPHGPDGVLAFAIMLGVLAAVVLGVNAYAAGVFGLTLYVVYAWRKAHQERHLERMADKDVARLDALTLQAREKHAQKIEAIKAALPTIPARTPTGMGRRGGRR